MKIRMGFVSNSSSSSFIVVVKKEDFEKGYESFSRLEKAAIDCSTDPITVFGMNLVKITGTSGNASQFEYDPPECDFELTDEEETQLDDLGWDCILDQAISKLDKYENITHYEDF